jgi:hypothetical protein
MDNMPKPQLPYVLHEIPRGKHFFYFRRGKGLRVRLHGEYGSPEFMESYYNLWRAIIMRCMGRELSRNRSWRPTARWRGGFERLGAAFCGHKESAWEHL